MIKWCLLSLLLLAVRPCLASSVTVTTLDYHGWKHACLLSNGIVNVVVVPSIGRVMSFALKGHPETNPLYDNAHEAGKAAPPENPFPKEWINFGGDKLWPAPQSDWGQHQPLSWPPDPSLEDGPYRMTRIAGGMRLSGPVSPYYQLRITRDITLVPGRPEVRFRDTYIKARQAQGKQNGFLLGVWDVAQTRSDATVFMPVSHRGNFPVLGYHPSKAFPMHKPLQPAWGVLPITCNPTLSTKFGSDSPAGWIASLYDKTLVFSEHFTRFPNALYPDQGCNVDVYTNPGPLTPYIEMEVLGPMTHLHAGQQLVFSSFWLLQHLPHIPDNHAESQRLVIDRMRSAPTRGFTR